MLYGCRGSFRYLIDYRRRPGGRLVGAVRNTCARVLKLHHTRFLHMYFRHHILIGHIIHVPASAGVDRCVRNAPFPFIICEQSAICACGLCLCLQLRNTLTAINSRKAYFSGKRILSVRYKYKNYSNCSATVFAHYAWNYGRINRAGVMGKHHFGSNCSLLF